MLRYKTLEEKTLILSAINNSSCAALIKSANKNPNALNIDFMVAYRNYIQ